MIVRRSFDELSEGSDQEEDLRDKVPGLTTTSWLGCQAVVENPSAEVIVFVPSFTINEVSEKVHAIS